MANRYPPLPIECTIGDLYRPAMNIHTEAEAKDYFARLVERRVARGMSPDEAVKTEQGNLGYVAGYYDADTASRIMKLFGAAHPIFGTTVPNAQEALDAGKRLGARHSGKR